MKSIFDTSVREVVRRINNISQSSVAKWGRMNNFQVVRHCSMWEEMVLGKRECERVFVGRLFGKLALKSVLKNDKPLGKNSPTVPELLIKETGGDIEKEKKKWIALVQEYAAFNNESFVHPFFEG